MVLNEIAPEERARMRQRVQPVIDKYTQQVGEALVKQALADIGKVRAAAK
jgi:TRAP-type transport system periplasmic protein